MNKKCTGRIIGAACVSRPPFKKASHITRPGDCSNDGRNALGLAKLNPVVIDLWSSLLRTLAISKLLVARRELRGVGAQRLCELFELRGDFDGLRYCSSIMKSLPRPTCSPEAAHDRVRGALRRRAREIMFLSLMSSAPTSTARARCGAEMRGHLLSSPGVDGGRSITRALQEAYRIWADHMSANSDNAQVS
jgi:hypothetical protein